MKNNILVLLQEYNEVLKILLEIEIYKLCCYIFLNVYIMENYYKNKDVKKYCNKADNPNYDLHHFETPFRSLVVAPSGSGKSNFITNLIALFCKNKGTFDNIYIFCKSVDEPLYKYLGKNPKD